MERRGTSRGEGREACSRNSLPRECALKFYNGAKNARCDRSRRVARATCRSSLGLTSRELSAAPFREISRLFIGETFRGGRFRRSPRLLIRIHCRSLSARIINPIASRSSLRNDRKDTLEKGGGEERKKKKDCTRAGEPR